MALTTPQSTSPAPAGSSAGDEQFLPLALPYIGEEEIAAVTECLRSGWLTTGARTREFERRFAEFVGVGHAVALNSCTAALHLALEALHIRPGEEVLVPTLTFTATAEVVRYLGARPVLVDCDPETLNLDLEWVRAYLEERCTPGEGGPRNRETGALVRALIPVHFAGLPCPMDRLLQLAERHGLAVVEDAAHALPAYRDGRHLGTFGRLGAFSFYATKTITTGEGGMLTTDDEALANRVRMMSLHGIDRHAWKRYTAEGSWYYEVHEAGFKYNLTDIAAALGLVQLGRAEQLWERRRAIASRYTEAFGPREEVRVPPGGEARDLHSWHLYVLRLNLDRLSVDRGRFIELLRERNLGASVHFIPLHLHPYYRDTFGYRPQDLPAAATLYPTLVSLPFYPRMSDGDVERVIGTVCEVLDAHRR